MAKHHADEEQDKELFHKMSKHGPEHMTKHHPGHLSKSHHMAKHAKTAKMGHHSGKKH